MTSAGISTIQSWLASREASRHTGQTGSSENIRQRSHLPMPATASARAADNRPAPSGSRSSRWKAMRWADFCPTPGRQRRVSMSWTSSGEYTMGESTERQLHPRRQAHTRGEAGHLLPGRLLHPPDGIVHGRRDEVLEHLPVVADKLVVDLDSPHLVPAIHADLDHAGTGLAGHLDARQLLLSLLHLLLHLLRLLHQLAESTLHSSCLRFCPSCVRLVSVSPDLSAAPCRAAAPRRTCPEVCARSDPLPALSSRPRGARPPGAAPAAPGSLRRRPPGRSP